MLRNVVYVVVKVRSPMPNGRCMWPSMLVIIGADRLQLICSVVRLQVPENACEISRPGQVVRKLRLLGRLSFLVHLTQVLLSIISMRVGMLRRNLLSVLVLN